MPVFRRRAPRLGSSRCRGIGTHTLAASNSGRVTGKPQVMGESVHLACGPLRPRAYPGVKRLVRFDRTGAKTPVSGRALRGRGALRPRSRPLPRPLAHQAARPVGAQRSWPHAQRRERRRHVLQRRAAARALRRGNFRDADPVATSIAHRIDALHGPAGQVLHRLPHPQRRQRIP